MTLSHKTAKQHKTEMGGGSVVNNSILKDFGTQDAHPRCSDFGMQDVNSMSLDGLIYNLQVEEDPIHMKIRKYNGLI